MKMPYTLEKMSTISYVLPAEFEGEENIIPTGYTRIDGANGPIIEGADYYWSCFKKWLQVKGYPTIASLGNNYKIIRHKETAEALTSKSKPKFKVGDEIMFRLEGSPIMGRIVDLPQTMSNHYIVKADSEAEFEIVLHENVIEKVLLTVGDHVVEEKPNGIQVGCTFVSDELIRRIAVMRKIVKE